MNKLYYIKSKNYELAELHYYNCKDKLANLEYDFVVEGSISEEEYEKIGKEYQEIITELEKAFNNIYWEGYKGKAEWKYVTVINKYATIKASKLSIA